MITKQQKRTLFLSSLGGALEFYDFIVFIFLAKTIGNLFFPSANPFISLLASLAVFAVGYLARPLGGIVFGHLGDTSGRKKTFIATVVFMAIPTFLIGFLPTYQTLGATASVLLIIFRLMQGFSVGGEIPGAIVFAAETILVKNRGLATGMILFGINMGLLAGSLVAAGLFHFFTMDQIMNGAWRIPFILGGVLGIVSFYLRLQLQETAVFKNLEKNFLQVKLPIKEMFIKHKGKLLQGIAIVSLEAVVVSIIYLYMPTYLATYFNFSLPTLLILNTVNIFIFSLPVILTSYLSDIVGRKKIIIAGMGCFILFSYPLFLLFYLHSFSFVVAALFIFSFFSSAIAGCFPCMMSELFPTEVRYSGVAITYNVGFGIIGGLTPLISTSLIHLTHNNLAPSFFLMIMAIIGFITILFMDETKDFSLEKI